LPDRLVSLLRAHAQDGHLAAVRLGQAEPFLDRVLVEFVDDPVDRCAVEPRVVGPERALSPRVGDLLDADDDVHDRWPTSLPCRTVRPAFASGLDQDCQTRPSGPDAGVPVPATAPLCY